MKPCRVCKWMHDRQSPYCNTCSLAADTLRAAFTSVAGPFVKGHPCVDCGRPATGRDHRDYGRLDLWEYVCHSCNKKRGPAKFPPHVASASRSHNRLSEKYGKMKAKLERQIEKLKAELSKAKELKP